MTTMNTDEREERVTAASKTAKEIAADVTPFFTKDRHARDYAEQRLAGRIEAEITAAATRMREACVQKVRSVRHAHRVSNNQDYEYGYEAAMDQVEANLESLTLDSVAEKGEDDG